jgi:hypothetical protein
MKTLALLLLLAGTARAADPAPAKPLECPKLHDYNETDKIWIMRKKITFAWVSLNPACSSLTVKWSTDHLASYKYDKKTMVLLCPATPAVPPDCMKPIKKIRFDDIKPGQQVFFTGLSGSGKGEPGFVDVLWAFQPPAGKK